LTLHPDVQAVYTHNDGMMVGVRKALQEAGKLDEMLTFAFDGEPVAIEAIKEGTQTATMGVVPAQEGAMGVIVGVMHLQGQSVPHHIYTPSTLVTQANFDTFPGWSGIGMGNFVTKNGEIWNPSE
jgi:ribose transport system substrate-binding protein